MDLPMRIDPQRGSAALPGTSLSTPSRPVTNSPGPLLKQNPCRHQDLLSQNPVGRIYFHPRSVTGKPSQFDKTSKQRTVSVLAQLVYHSKAGPFQGRLLLWAQPSQAPAKAACFQPLATPAVLRFGPMTGGGIETSPKLVPVLRFSAGERAGVYGPCPNWVTNWD
jgi:hypothetical protein